MKELKESLEISSPTIRSRMNSLIENKFFKIVGVMDASKTSTIVTAIVGIKLRADLDIETALADIAALNQVQWACIVTGQYDIMAQIMSTRIFHR